MRTTLLFNDGWLFAPEPLQDFVPDDRFTPITLPHTNHLLPHHNFNDSEYQFISTYRKRFSLPEARAGRRVFLDFEGAMIAATVSINGHTFPEHKGGYTPFSLDITDHLNDYGHNLLSVRLDSTERADIPPCGGLIDYLTFGGIYRDVHLRYVESVHIEDVFVKGHGLMYNDERAEIVVTVRNHTDQVQSVAVVGALAFWRDEMGLLDVPPRDTARISLWSDLREFPNKGKLLWSLDAPNLHTFDIRLFAQVGLNSPDEQQYDAVQARTGFRDAHFGEDGFYLNGEKIALMGLNRHQTFPYIGQAAPPRLQKRDADIIKYELGCNIVRTSHYPQSRHFLDRCDEIGLLVFEEIPGWQHIGDVEWQRLSLRDVRAMIERDRNRPSIVLWGVRINESFDDGDFYTATNALARELDPTRQTSGVRFWQQSEFLEDVFGFNDFSDAVMEPENTPHLVTEFNGHMFPTKTWDHEERQIEHAMRHARIQDQQLGMWNVTGAIGWCAFDYNTHRDFGSGDRVCYHGVMDMFRLPKWAAAVYASQVPPSRKIIMEAATMWTIGDRSAGGNDPLTVLTNCDSVEMYIGEQKQGRFAADRVTFPNLPYPPVIIANPMIWGQRYEDLHLYGYIGDERVIEEHIALDGVPHHLEIGADDATINADGADMTRVWFKITDAYGNRLPYAITPITLTHTGPGELIGDNPFPLVGGQAAVYVKAGHESGTVTVTASAARLETVAVTIEIE